MLPALHGSCMFLSGPGTTAVVCCAHDLPALQHCNLGVTASEPCHQLELLLRQVPTGKILYDSLPQPLVA